ncbi:adenosine deaminase [Schleiferilactobacillus harbinensis]|uniref:adenosine deaminase n=1 Tax=Schleiferilactobacillus harbinensis TaxID=304207 RepID=UPI001168305F|nr:adenosine deaminase [Schleiferilactobacillus harbinensis]GEK07381.1 adenosine deaminase [Schleiferilactobacillus harbinensis]
MSGFNETIAHQLPKVELHCHLDGSISIPTIREIADMQHIPIPATDAELAEKVIAPANVQSLGEYLERFDFIGPLLQVPKALTLAAFDVAAQAARENVRYLEVRFAPTLSTDKSMTEADTIIAVAKGLERAKTELGITTRILVCGMRQQPIDRAIAAFTAANSLRDRGVVGVDFAGDEAHFPPRTMQPAVDYAAAHQIPLTFHAGECGCVENVVEAIKLGAKRIGHGTAIHGHADALALAHAQNTLFEICLTSNLQTKAAVDITHFHYRDLVAANVPFNISTDNRTVSHTNLTREYMLFHQGFGLEAADFQRSNLISMAHAFADQATIDAVTKELKADYAQLALPAR